MFCFESDLIVFRMLLIFCVLQSCSEVPNTDKCNRPRSHDPEKVRLYMKAKRARLLAERKKREVADEKLRASIKERLLALEVWRKKEAKAPPESIPSKVEVSFSII